jgi:diguanylate cyclase (GGDEF)-like protein/PAS domain S-box-containing protein
MNPRVVELVLKRCLGHREGETLCVVADTPMAMLGRAFADAAIRMGIETAFVTMAPRQGDGEEPPAAVSAALESSALGLLLTSMSLSHTEARRRASGRGSRIASMPGADGSRLERLLDIDYADLADRCRRLADLLRAARQLRLTSDAGTDLTCELGAAAYFLDAGRFDAPGAFGNLPAGEVCFAPAEGKANGVAVIDGSLAQLGRLPEPIRLVVRDGRAVEVSHPGLRSMLERAGPAAFVVAEIGFGMNLRARVVGNVLEDEKAAGTAHVALGDNVSFGGTNRVALHLDGVLLRPRVLLDGRQVPPGDLGWPDPAAPDEAAAFPPLLSVGPDDIEAYRLLFEHSNDAQYILDLETQQFIEVNARFEQLTGYYRQELLQPALRAGMLIARESLPTYQRKVQNRRSVTSERYDLRILSKAGDKLPVEISVKRISLNGREVVIGTVHDLTERKKIEQELWLKIEDLGNANNRIFALTEKIKPVPLLMSQVLDIADENELIARTAQLLGDRQGLAFPGVEIYLVSGDVLELRHPPPARSGRRHRLDSSHRLVQALHAGVPQIAARSALLPLKGRERTLGLLALDLDPKVVDLLAGNEQVLKAFHDLLVTLANILGLRLDNLRLYKTVQLQSILDDLTGVFNRRHFAAKLADEIQRSRRYGRELSLMMIDIDHFKTVNDTHGHKQGDCVLAELGKILRDQTRDVDILCRYGGDEFAILLPETPKDGAAAKAELLRMSVKGYRFTNLEEPDRPLTLTLSIGVAGYRLEWRSGEDLLRWADEALYKAKREGRDRIVAV